MILVLLAAGQAYWRPFGLLPLYRQQAGPEGDNLSCGQVAIALRHQDRPNRWTRLLPALVEDRIRRYARDALSSF